MPVHDLLVRNGVNIVFHGHDHFFARQELDGITYQLVPQPGRPGSAKPPRFAAEYGYHEGELLGGSGHLRVRVSPDRVRIDYVIAGTAADHGDSTEDSSVGFRYTISPRVAEHPQ
jgi:hypothetical protein